MITAAADAQPFPSKSVDLTVLNSFGDSDLGGDAELIVELIDLYQDEAAKLVETIRTALLNNDWTTIKRAAHSLRGSSSNLGIAQMALIADDLEHREFEDTSSAEPLLHNLTEELARVNVILNIERNRRTA